MAFGRSKANRTPVIGTNQPVMGKHRVRKSRKQPILATPNTSTRRGGTLSGFLSGRRNRGTALTTKSSAPVLGTNTHTRRSSLGQKISGLGKKIVGAVTRDRRMEAAGTREMHGKRSLFGSRP
jgi:hypothetical protein